MENYYSNSHKWVQKEGTHCDDITFANGEIKVDFDEWIERYYNK